MGRQEQDVKPEARRRAGQIFFEKLDGKGFCENTFLAKPFFCFAER
jgi:hypothetical protein